MRSRWSTTATGRPRSRSHTAWWATRGGRGRGPGGLPFDLAQPGALQRERGSVRNWILGIVHNRTIDSLRRNQVHDRRRASAEGIEETQAATELTDVEALRREEARTVRAALERLPERAVAGDRARLLRRLHPHGDRRHARDPRRYREGPDAPRAREAATRPGGGGMSDDRGTNDDHGRHAENIGAYAARRAPRARGRRPSSAT